MTILQDQQGDGGLRRTTGVLHLPLTRGRHRLWADSPTAPRPQHRVPEKE